MSYEAVSVEHDSGIDEIEDVLYPQHGFREPDNTGDRSYLLHESDNGAVVITEEEVMIEYGMRHEADEMWERDAERYLNDIVEYRDSRIDVGDLFTDHESEDMEFPDVALMDAIEDDDRYGFATSPGLK